MIAWLRNVLGVPATYRCPDPSCGSFNVIPYATITRPQPGQPWKQRKVGCLVSCASCRLVYMVTLDGGVARLAYGDQGRAVRGTTPPGEGQVSNRELEALLGDVRQPPDR